MKTRKKDRVRLTEKQKDKLYSVVSRMIGEKTGETPEAVLDRISRRAVQLQRQRLSGSPRHRKTNRSGFMPNTQAKAFAKSLT